MILKNTSKIPETLNITSYPKILSDTENNEESSQVCKKTVEIASQKVVILPSSVERSGSQKNKWHTHNQLPH